jgi:hypothetical protein
MQVDNKTTEFELSFNFKNVLYITQVTAWRNAGGEYYILNYFSPNEKGKIHLLRSVDEQGGKWEEPGHAHDKEFILEVQKQLEQKN